MFCNCSLLARGPVAQEFVLEFTTLLPDAEAILVFLCMKANSMLPTEMFTRFVKG